MSAGRGTIAALGLLLVFAGCRAGPAEDYVVTGTLEIAEPLARDVPRIERGIAIADLVMTVRTSPDVGDVVIQRRWKGVRFPHEFGLGKGRARELRAKLGDRPVFVTALVDVFAQGREAGPTYSLVGWTRKPVPIGTFHIDLKCDRLLGTAGADDENRPTGGWFSNAVIEEAIPPGLRPQRPGPEVFSGRLDVDDPAERAKFVDYRLFIVASEKPADGMPRLITSYDHPVFPFKFSLHENQAMSPDLAGPLEAPHFVIAILDGDGNVGTKDDQIRVATQTPLVAPASGIDLIIPVKNRAAALPESRPNASTSRPATSPSTGPGLLAGRVELPQELADAVGPNAVLFLSARDERGSLALVRRVDAPRFPYEFSLSARDAMIGYDTSLLSGKLRVKAKITDGPDALLPSRLERESEPVAVGTTDLVLVLQRP